MGKKNRLLENIFSMVSLRAMEYILGFLLVPYLLTVLGPTQYGAIAFMQGIIAYFNLFANYGFNLTAPRDIAQHNEDCLSKLFSTFFWGKAFILIGVTFLFGLGYILLSTLGVVHIDLPLFLAVYISAIGTVLFPVWFFQGVQQMRYITILNLAGRLITILLLFLLVKKPEDYILAAFLQSCTPFFAGILSWKIIHKFWPGILHLPDKENLITAYKEGWQIFLSTLAINLYTTSDIVILGILTNNTIVGYYSGADKLISCVKRGVSAVNDAVYPYISRVMTNSKAEGLKFLKKQFFIYIICGTIGGVMIALLSPTVIPRLLGPKYIPSIAPLQIMAFVPLIVAMSNVLGYETMLPLGMEKNYSKILGMASVVNLAIIVPLIIWKQASGTAIAMLITECFVTLSMAYSLWKMKII